MAKKKNEIEREGAMRRGDNAPLDARERLTDEDAKTALSILQHYRQGKANLENALIEDERWYQLRHWEYMRRHSNNYDRHAPEPTSAWLFNAIASKHADAMDNYPEPNVLPREQGDEQDAKTLSEVLPVILERCDFEQVYSDNWWEKLKHGTAVYGIFFDKSLDNGLGDIVVKPVDLLNIYWEPGVNDIQDSRNVFVVTLRDIDLIKAEHPELGDKLKGGASPYTAQYRYDESIDISGKEAIIDWYYKTSIGGKQVLHYAQICGDKLLYASQNDPACVDGWYESMGSASYPFVFDTLYPVKGTPCGFGYVQLCKDPQLYIDKLSANILESSMAGSKLRYFVRDDVGINEEEFKDWNAPFVHFSGKLTSENLQQMTLNPPAPLYMNVLQQKIEEMKETSANRDVNNGGGVGASTAAATVAALQEAGNKMSRDMIARSHNCYKRATYMVLDRARQFYDDTRTFRITGASGDYQFVEWNNSGIKEQVTGMDSEGNQTVRVPIFDIVIKPQKRSPFAREAQNQRALELYGAGFFAPENAQAALTCLDMMEFDGIEQMREKVAQGQTLLNMVQQMAQQMQEMQMVLGIAAGMPNDAEGEPAAEDDGSHEVHSGSNRTVASKMLSDQSGNAMTEYQKRIKQNARADVSGGMAGGGV